jgi:hypothetical protein
VWVRQIAADLAPIATLASFLKTQVAAADVIRKKKSNAIAVQLIFLPELAGTGTKEKKKASIDPSCLQGGSNPPAFLLFTDKAKQWCRTTTVVHEGSTLLCATSIYPHSTNSFQHTLLF